MSNNEWNDGQGNPVGPENQPGQSSANEWDAGADQPSVPDWNHPAQPPASGQEPPQSGGAWAASQGQEWNTRAHTQASANEGHAQGHQASAHEGHAQGQQSWNQDPQDQQPWNQNAQDQQSWNQNPQDQQPWNQNPQDQQPWNQNPQDQQPWNQNPQDQQPWNQNPQDQQSWNQNPQGGFAAGQQWQPQPVKRSTGFGNVLDFSFKKFALPEAGGTIFLIVMIGFLVKWLLDLIWTLSFTFDFSDLMRALLGNLALAVVGILLSRAFLEGMSALVKLAAKDKDA